MSDFDLYGIFIPSFLVQAIIAYFIYILVSKLTKGLIESGWIAFSGVFNLCLYVLCLVLIHYIFIWFTLE